MEMTRQQLPDGETTIIDDSHNATMVSMLAALNVFKDETAHMKAKRKIVVLGSVAELEDQSAALHESLAEPLLSLNPDKVFFHGNDMKYLVDKLPKEIIGGLFYDVQKLADTVAAYARDGDYILLKGSRGGANFYEIKRRLTAAMNAILSGSKPAVGEASLLEGVAVPYATGVCSDGAPSGVPVIEGTSVLREGLGGGLILMLALSMVASNALGLTDPVVCTDYAARQAGDPRSAGLVPGESIPLLTLIELIVIKNAPDAMVAVADHIAKATGKRTYALLAKAARKMSLGIRARENLTGRNLSSSQHQVMDVNDLLKFAGAFFALPHSVLKLLNINTVFWRDRCVEGDSELYFREDIIFYYCFGWTAYNAVVQARINGKTVLAAVCGAGSVQERDAAICGALDGFRRSAAN
jgi:hypothetical protein